MLLAPLTPLSSSAAAAGGPAPEPAPAKPGFERRIVVLDAPSNLGLRPPAPGKLPGVYRLPQAFRRQRIVERLGARDGGSVPPPPYSPDPDRTVGFRNGTALAAYTRSLADRVAEHVRRKEFVLLLGGDCSILLGSTLGLRRLGPYALASIDAHDDFSYVRDRRRYEGFLTAAGLDIALVTGHGPDALSDIDGLRPYVPEERVIHLGLMREEGDSVSYATETFDHSKIRSLSAEEIRRMGASRAGAEARRYLESQPVAGYFVHLDADVLDSSIMPAVDSPNPEGLGFAQLTDLLAELLRSPKMVGLELTILDPDLDPDGTYVARFTDAVVAAFQREAR